MLTRRLETVAAAAGLALWLFTMFYSETLTRNKGVKVTQYVFDSSW